MTREEFIKILPAYVGCEVSASGVDKNSTFIAFIPMSDGWGNLYYQNVFGSICNHTTRIYISFNFKLLLRRLEDMTEEEKKVLQSIKDFNAEENRKAVAADTGAIWLTAYGDRDLIPQSSRIIRYLNSIGVDTDGLLGTEWAELKTTTEL